LAAAGPNGPQGGERRYLIGCSFRAGSAPLLGGLIGAIGPIVLGRV